MAVILMHSTGAEELAAEQSVLGAVFLDSNVLDDIVFLEDRDFSSVRHQQIYKVMRFLEKRGNPVDIITVTEAFERFGGVKNIGGVNYLSNLAASCPTTANVEYYARIIRSKAMERRMKNTADIIKGMSRDDYDSDEEFFSYIENLVSEMRPQDNAKMKTFAEMRQDYFKHLKTPAQYIPTGFEQFDAWAKGLWRKWLFISAGRPSVGKTALLLQRLQGVAMQNKGAVLLFSQEMSREQVIDRWLSNATGISYQRIKHKNLDSKDMDKILIAYEAFEDLPLYVQDSAGVTIDEVKATAKQIKKKHGRIAVIAIDYLQIMRIPQKKGESRATAIGNVTGEAKRIAMDLDCCIILLSQMSRTFETASKPQLSHLKESGSIEQDADVVEFLWHDPNDTTSGGKVIQQTIAKGRDTGLNDFRLLFQGYRQRFSELKRES
ncbi:DnaB-like helicase C-terminal domain-containing protein [Robertmurraya sp. DFI.2.37]|uniref:replicative DNA helicase n=1 Tax=Robertmurraya sp. DFI.2.37 TaxID=3031819 RepID=UPI001CDA511C|nr:DnaB-like helicase C-terminal domain-containing protein [Robertmurraya sp. DFI.2.37]MDF1511081.1 DnaB-like helicase C-terminal domain-containing protein [Robertmurraya sp. DFI.2.37]